MPNNIVNVVVSQQVAPAPLDLQRTGYVISQGGTILAPGTKSIITQPSDLTPLIPNALPVTNAVWSGGVATLTTASAHKIAVGDTVEMVVTGFTPSGYNGTVLVTSTGASTLTYLLPTSPGTATTLGAVTEEDVGELSSAVGTFFTQGRYRSCYVLELGPGNANDGVAALSAYLTANPLVVYAILVPRYWDGNPNFLALLQTYSGTASLLYFFITTTLATYQLYTSLMKCAVLVIECPSYGAWQQSPLTAVSWASGDVTATTASAQHGVVPGQWFQLQGCVPTAYNGWALALPGTTGNTLVYALATNPGPIQTEGSLVGSGQPSAGIPSTEFTAASFFWKAISYNPSSTNKVAPYCYSFLYGVTPFPVFQNSGLLATLKAAAVNVVLTGAEGGISNTMIVPGTTKDNRKYNYWYAVDWMNVNSQRQVAAAIIDGSNNALNPLYLNQRGIDRLSTVEAGVVTSGTAFGLVLFGPVETSLVGTDLDTALDAGTYNGYSVVNAVPFVPYYQLNPDDYGNGEYDGISVTFTPQNGFDNVTINIVASDFVVSGSL